VTDSTETIPTTPPPARVKRLGASNREAAEHFGVSTTTVGKDWERKKWVVRYPDRSIDLAATALKVNANRDPSRGGAVNRGIGAVRPAIAVDPTDVPPESLPLPPGMDLTEARTRKEYWQAVRAEAEARKLQGELVPKAEAERVYLEVITAARANLEGVPVRVTPKLIGLTDPFAIRELVRLEIETALRSLPNVPPAIPID